MEQKLVFFVIYFPRVERALLFCVIYFCVWNALWYLVLYFSACGTCPCSYLTVSFPLVWNYIWFTQTFKRGAKNSKLYFSCCIFCVLFFVFFCVVFFVLYFFVLYISVPYFSCFFVIYIFRVVLKAFHSLQQPLMIYFCQLFDRT